jgi:hypothetical protein
LSKEPRRNCKLCFCVSDSIQSDSLFVESKVLSILHNKIKGFYGGVWKYPTIFSSEAYFSGACKIPHSYSFTETQDHSQRLSQCRSNTYHYEKFKQHGAFKEIYPICYLTLQQAQLYFGDVKLEDYMRQNGELSLIDEFTNVLRWQVDSENLQKVRSELESSGLVFSAEL